MHYNQMQKLGSVPILKWGFETSVSVIYKFVEYINSSYINTFVWITEQHD